MRLMKYLLALAMISVPSFAADLRLGIIGTDTSHVIAFSSVLNNPSHPDHIPGARIVAAYKGGSSDVESSYTRVDKYAEELKAKWNIEIVPDIPTLCSKVDAILLESVDGRKHLEQAKQVIAAKKPMFIDKPLASTLEDAREIARLAKAAGVPWFSTSSLRLERDRGDDEDLPTRRQWLHGVRDPPKRTIYLDLSWYAIHPVEMLFAMMGPGLPGRLRGFPERVSTP